MIYRHKIRVPGSQQDRKDPKMDLPQRSTRLSLFRVTQQSRNLTAVTPAVTRWDVEERPKPKTREAKSKDVVFKVA